MTAFLIDEFYKKIKDFPWIDIEYPTHKYAIEVVTGKRIACKWEKLSCERHLRDLLRQDTEGFPYIFDFTRSNLIFNFFKKRCTHVKGVLSGQPIELVSYQKYDLGSMFGWVRVDNGYRRFKYSYDKMGRGQAKSTTQSGITLYMMTEDCYYPPFEVDKRKYDMSPSVYCTAYDKKQAKIVWQDACDMGNASPGILKQLDIRKTKVTHKTRGGKLEALSKDTKNKDGLSVTAAIIDEYHTWKSSEVYDVIKSAFGKRPQELLNIITTAGKDAENSPCKTEEEICKKILEGYIESENYFINIRELDKNDNPHDESVWPKANPMLLEKGEYAEGLYNVIKLDHDIAYGSNDTAKIREFLTKRCDLWCYDDDNRFMDGLMDRFKSLAIPRDEFLELTKGKECIAGIDMSKATDLTATANIFKLDDERIAITAHGYIAENRAREHEKSDRVPYLQWAEDGWCTLTPGDVVDYKYLVKAIINNDEEYNWHTKEITYDPYAAEYATQDLEEEGYIRVKVPQRMATLSEPTKLFKKLVMEDKIVFDSSPLFTWCVSNAIAKTDDQENVMLSKKNRKDSQRIDLLAATINALSRVTTLKTQSFSFMYVPKKKRG